jgi:hypothetical protein
MVERISPIASGHRRRGSSRGTEAARREREYLRQLASFMAAGGACPDSLGDLNFMEEPSMVVWIIRQIGCWIIGG